MLHIFSSRKRLIAQCERSSPVFWVMHEQDDTPDVVQVSFLDANEQVLHHEQMPYSPTEREATLRRIEQIRQAWIFKIC